MKVSASYNFWRNSKIVYNDNVEISYLLGVVAPCSLVTTLKPAIFIIVAERTSNPTEDNAVYNLSDALSELTSHVAESQSQRNVKETQ